MSASAPVRVVEEIRDSQSNGHSTKIQGADDRAKFMAVYDRLKALVLEDSDTFKYTPEARDWVEEVVLHPTIHFACVSGLGGLSLGSSRSRGSFFAAERDAYIARNAIKTWHEVALHLTCRCACWRRCSTTMSLEVGLFSKL